ncbi:hypothetical protein BD769DRAFT_1390375 [Suillus cothurnatus]|nr:hypothetical protein BD769DRAFT_1390375 [Suillus cothurnatus]
MPRDMVFLLLVSFLVLQTLPPLSKEHQPELRRFTAEDTNNEGWNTSPRSCLHKLLGKPDFKTGPAQILWTIDSAHHPKLFPSFHELRLDIKMGKFSHTNTTVGSSEGTSKSVPRVGSDSPDSTRTFFELAIYQQPPAAMLSATIDNDLVPGFYSNLDDQPILTYHSPCYYHCDSLHAADHDGPSTSMSIPPQLLPYGTSAMSLNQPSHHQPEYQSHIMAPTFDSDGAVHDHFQADSEAGSMYLQMQSHHDHAAGLHLAVVTPAFSPASHYSAPGPPSHLYHLPKHLSSFLQGYNQPFLTGGGDALLPLGVEEHACREEILNVDIPSQDASHSQTNVKQHCTTTFHPYQWPLPRKSRLFTQKRRESGLQSQVSDSVPSMAAPPQPVIISAPSVLPPQPVVISAPSMPPPNPSELPYNLKNKQHQ